MTMGNKYTNRELRRFYVLHGICQNCGQSFVEPGHTLCNACICRIRRWKAVSDPDGSKAKQYKAELMAYKRANGICLSCSRKASPGRVRCNKCLAAAREAEQVRRMKKRLEKQMKTGL